MDIEEPQLTIVETNDDEHLLYLKQHGVQNLNPRYALVGYNIDIINQSLKSQLDETIIAAAPITTIDPHSIFYQSHPKESEDLLNEPLVPQELKSFHHFATTITQQHYTKY